MCSSTLLLENEKVRVTLFDFDPGQETGWHVHEYDYVITAVTVCLMMLQHPDGRQTILEVPAGNAYSRDACVSHNVINTSDHQMSFIEIELKNSSASTKTQLV
jgi:quercetin dioxygenase-like cupin family protein